MLTAMPARVGEERAMVAIFRGESRSLRRNELERPDILACIAYFVAGDDIGKFTIKVADDVRTRNKVLHFRPQSNFVTLNEFASLWEKKIGKEVPRKFISEDSPLRLAKENRIPSIIVAALTHDIFIKGCQFAFEIDGPQIQRLAASDKVTMAKDHDERSPPKIKQSAEDQDEGYLPKIKQWTDRKSIPKIKGSAEHKELPCLSKSRSMIVGFLL
ncbi:hypothetical protein EJ110_NYTH43302 [Nymphaea thermarum]|nr:hypothetical protein EJ110_NYTH43302 [Nymphaea thermarum]